MLSALHAAASTDNSSWLPAVITGSAVVLAAIITALVAKYRPGRKPKPVPRVTPTPLSDYSGPQNDFITLVINDSKAIREEMADMRKDLEHQIADLENQLRDERATTSLFRSAVRRYLQQVAQAWTGPDPMPVPSEADAEILGETIQVRRTRATPSTT